MVKGETYRHVHYLHDYAYRSGCKFMCYDVVCKYWSFAQDISEAIEEFKFHTTSMDPFLSRWHTLGIARYFIFLSISKLFSNLP